MNILMVCPYFYSKACRIKLRPDIYEVSKRLVQRGHRVFVLTSKTHGTPEHEVLDGVEIHRVFSLSLPKIYYFIPFIPQFVGMLLKICEEHDIQIVHFWNYEYLTSVLAVLLRTKLKNLPFIMTVVGFPGLNWMYGETIVDLVGKIYTFTLGRIIFAAVDQVILLGRNLVKYALWMGAAPDRVSVNSFGLDFEAFLPKKTPTDVRRQLGISVWDKIVIYVGRLEPVKGIRYLIDAAKSVSGKMKNVKFLVVGDGPLRSEVSLSPQMVSTGWRNDVPDLLNASDLFVLPSISEGLPLSILEAYALEKPVVATNVGAVSEIVIEGRSGLLVPPKDREQLSNAILHLLRRPQLMQNMGSYGKDLVGRNYDWHNILNNYERMYQLSRLKKARASVLNSTFLQLGSRRLAKWDP
jgi:glycosyltransferase involved in cell wall biosynthesis